MFVKLHLYCTGTTRFYKITFLCMIIFGLLATPAISMAQENDSMMGDLIEPQLEGKEIRDLQKKLEESMSEEAKQIFPYHSPGELMEELVGGGIQSDIQSLPLRIIDILIGELKENSILLIKLVFIIFLTAVIKNLQGSFKESTIGELAYFSCYGAVVTMVALGFRSVLEYAEEVLDTIDNITGFAIPALLALLISGGNLVSGSALQPVLILAIQGTVKIFRTVFLPLCYMAGIIYIVSGLSERIKISGMASILKQIVTWGLAGILTIYGSIVAIQGTAGAVIDGAAAKTAKTAMNTLIPVAGKYMADAADTIINCALVIKNTAGIATMIVTLTACFIPILKIFVMVFMYRFAAAVIEPIAEERLFDCLTDVSDCMKTVLGVVGAALFMFLLSVGVLLGAGGISGMMQ